MDSESSRLCACGCGTTIPALDRRGKPRHYVSGHNHGAETRRERATAPAQVACACGCGGLLAPFDSKGRPRRYLSGHNNVGRSRKGQKGRPREPRLRPDGYVRVFVPGHPLAHADGYALEHRYVLYEAGVAIPPGHHVHHLNGIKSDNRPENLAVIPEEIHHSQHIRAAGFVENQFGVWPLRDDQEPGR